MSIFGFSTQSAADFTPILKFNAIAGQFILVERVAGETQQSIIKRDSFKAVIDLHNLEAGWIDFSAASPTFSMVLVRNLYDENTNPNGVTLPPRPTGGEPREGLRFLIKLAKQITLETPEPQTITVERPIREMASCAKAFTGSIETLYVEYLAKGPTADGTKLPVVVCTGILPIKTGTGAKQSTAFRPQFRIESWANRPADLIYRPRVAVVTRAGNGGNGSVFNQSSHPSTGSRTATAPRPQAPQAQRPPADDGDFG